MKLFLEKRTDGTFYFRQTKIVNNKQIAKRINLKTRCIKTARILAIQILARLQMDKFKKFDAVYDNQGNLIKVNVDTSNPEDMKSFMLLQQQIEDSRAFKHKRELEMLRAEAELAELKRDKSQDESNKELYVKLTQQYSGETLEVLIDTYFKKLKVKNVQTRSKYLRIVTNFHKYCLERGIKYLNQIDRKNVVLVYIEYLKATKQPQKNIKNIMGVLGTFFRKQIANGETTNSNPFNGHDFDIEDEEGRLPFTTEELDKIFKSDFVRSNQQNKFILLLLLTTGARPNEICQLMAEDIYKDISGDFHILDINDDGYEKTLKNRASKRKIYIHQLLIDHGFLDYLGTRSNKRLFDLKKPKGKNFSVIFSEDFTELLRSELEIKVKVLYCFRHTCINRLKQHKINVEIREDLTGHTPEGVNGKTYSQKFSAEMLRNETQEILKYKEIESSFFEFD
ncbi:MAG: site-specific integrase [Methylophilus sp.]|uniref:site-specific integrase n=1 Tax=Methylophilus sp. TaxID=29541 RepID=UPI003F9F0594